ncbi:MAG: hypothetical protein AAGF58_07115 [Pseudomonadota bacterium]
MVILRTLLWQAAKHVALNPALRRTAVDVASRAKPTAQAALRETKRAAAEAPPLDDPQAFLRNLAGRAEKVKSVANRPVSEYDEDGDAEDLDPSEWKRVEGDEDAGADKKG